jgi:hypothetical protein
MAAGFEAVRPRQAEVQQDDESCLIKDRLAPSADAPLP